MMHGDLRNVVERSEQSGEFPLLVQQFVTPSTWMSLVEQWSVLSLATCTSFTTVGALAENLALYHIVNLLPSSMRPE